MAQEGELSQKEFLSSEDLPMTMRPTYEELERKIRLLEQESAKGRLAETTLRESEEKYRLLIENAGEAIFVAQQGMLQFFNRRTTNMFGHSPEELRSRPFTDFIHPDDRELVSERHRRRLQGFDVPSRYSFRILGPGSGNVIWVELTAVMIQWSGKPATLNFLSDITERKQAEEALRLSEERFRVAFQTSPDAININRMEDGLFAAINDGFTALTGFTWEDVRGKTSLEINIWGDPSQRRKLVEGLRTSGMVDNLETTFRLKNGTLKTGLMSARVIILNNAPHILSVTRDIDEFRRTQEALQRSDAGYRQLFEGMSDIVYAWDQDGRIVSVNPAATRILGRSEKDIVGKHLRDIVADMEKELFEERMQRDLKGPAEGTIAVVSGDGRTCYLDYSSTVVQSDDGKRYVSGVARDVTERVESGAKLRLLQDQLLQAQKMESVGRLAGGVAHDFNNMLQAIIGHSEMAAMSLPNNHPLQKHLQPIRQSAEKSASIVRQLLAFARKQTVSPKVLDLNDTVATMLKMLGRLIGEDIDLVWMPGHGLWSVNIDPSQVDQVLANLVVNARDAISERGTVTIETHNAVLDGAYCAAHAGATPGEYVMLAVSDNGAGMSGEILEHVFEPFFTTKEQGKGTGLGLATVHGIIMQNNGLINVHSEPGVGTTLKIYLPRFSAAACVGTEAEAESMPGGRETVLIVEDEQAILLVAKEILTGLGYTVLCAETPSLAVRLADEHAGDIHLLITDVVMPEINGRELAEQISARRPGMKCLYMSGYPADVIARHGLLDEGILFIHKPFAMKDLAAKVREALLPEFSAEEALLI